MRRRPADIDDDVESVNQWEERQQRAAMPQSGAAKGKVLIGKVDQFFDKINVIAVNLTGTLKVGDIIEIGDDEEAVRQKVSSMQIDREDVSEASEGDDVGIKLKHPVDVGSPVYRIE
jgi:translation initiation factor IF-2